MIQTRITTEQASKAPNEVHLGLYVLKRLRADGVPVQGALFPIGVATGRLVYERDLFTDDLLITWSET